MCVCYCGKAGIIWINSYVRVLQWTQGCTRNEWNTEAKSSFERARRWKFIFPFFKWQKFRSSEKCRLLVSFQQKTIVVLNIILLEHCSDITHLTLNVILTCSHHQMDMYDLSFGLFVSALMHIVLRTFAIFLHNLSGALLHNGFGRCAVIIIFEEGLLWY